MIPQGHSPLGGSGAGRFLACPGSVSLSKGFVPEVEEDNSFSAPGTAAHEVAETALKKGGETWRLIGTKAENGIEIDKEIVDAAQVFVNAVKSEHDPATWEMGVNAFIEQKFHRPELHELFYGTADFVYVDTPARTLHVWDYKHGAGVLVEVKDNAQGKYYASGVLQELDLWGEIDNVVIHIVQPRGFHSSGPIREWSVSTEQLGNWLYDTLIPGMDKALVSRETKAGMHCRFCPVRWAACPALAKVMDEIEEMLKVAEEKGGVNKLTMTQAARFVSLMAIGKIAEKAAYEALHARAQKGQKIDRYGLKLVKADKHRIFRDGAEDAAVAEFGKKRAYETKLLSPAKIDGLPNGKKFTAEWAYKPEGGTRIVLADDNRVGVKREKASGVFKKEEK